MRISGLFARSALVGASLFALASAASAQQPFDGPYIGVNGGWQQERLSINVDDGLVTETFRGNTSGFAYGIHAGYDFNIGGNGILGVEAALGGTTGDFDSADSDVTLSAGRTIELVARAGALISNDTLIYARGGYSNARYTLTVDGLGSGSTNRDGFTVGAGIEHAFTPNVSARIEYAYSKWDNYRLADDVAEATFRPSRNAVKAGVSYRF